MKLLIISDIHGNMEALRAVEKAAGPVDDILFLGDVLDYGPRPRECLQWLRDRGGIFLKGNHDHAVTTREDCRCGASFKEYSILTREYMWKILDESDYRFFDNLFPCRAEKIDGIDIYASHAAPSDPFYKYLRPETETAALEDEVRDLDVKFVFLGHTHFPMERTACGTSIINPGSVGQPRDGVPLAAYALWNDGDVSLHRVEYDYEKTCDDLKALPLPQHAIIRLCEVLRTGK